MITTFPRRGEREIKSEVVAVLKLSTGMLLSSKDPGFQPRNQKASYIFQNRAEPKSGKM